MPPKPETLYPVQTNRRETFELHNRVVLGVAGVVSSQTAEKYAGFVVTKTGGQTGRYTITLTGGRRASLLNINVIIIGTSSAALTTAKGMACVPRQDDIGTDGTIEIQFVQSSLADTEIQDSLSFMITLKLAKV